MSQRLIDLFHQDLADQSSTKGRLTVGRYWFRALGLTIMERGITPIPFPKRGTHGLRVERFRGFWRGLPDDQLYEVFYHLKPFFSNAKQRDTALT